MSMKKEDTNIPPDSRFGDDTEYVMKNSRAKELQHNQQHPSQRFGKR